MELLLDRFGFRAPYALKINGNIHCKLVFINLTRPDRFKTNIAIVPDGNVSTNLQIFIDNKKVYAFLG